MDECTERVNSKSNTTETCVQELFDFLHCVDHCVSVGLVDVFSLKHTVTSSETVFSELWHNEPENYRCILIRKRECVHQSELSD